MEECHKLLTDQVDDAILRYNVSKPLPLGGDPGHVTIQPDFFFNKDLEYLRCGLKKNASMTSLRCMVYLTGGFKDNGSTLIDTHLKSREPSSPEDKKILTTAVNLWTRNLVIRQRVEDFQLGIESYQTQLNLTKPRWDAKGFEYMHDIHSILTLHGPVTFRYNMGLDDHEGSMKSILYNERIFKKRTKNEAKTTKPDTEWKSVEKTQSSPSPSVEKSTQVNPDKPEAKSQEKQV
ncbi:hypothetical protein Tco_0252273 [Tanacetum coccineum]